MERLEVQLPIDKYAFDHPATRTAWVEVRRRVARSLTLWTVLWVMSFLTLSVVSGVSDVLGPTETAKSDVVGGFGAVTFLAYVFFFYVRVSSLRCLGRIRRVLQAHPWRPVPAARKPPDVKDMMGVPVQLRLGDASEEDTWTPLMTARNPVRRRRWPDAMESGAWYAGSIQGAGVLALPGGGELMEAQPRQSFQ